MARLTIKVIDQKTREMICTATFENGHWRTGAAQNALDRFFALVPASPLASQLGAGDNPTALRQLQDDRNATITLLVVPKSLRDGSSTPVPVATVTLGGPYGASPPALSASDALLRAVREELVRLDISIGATASETVYRNAIRSLGRDLTDRDRWLDDVETSLKRAGYKVDHPGEYPAKVDELRKKAREDGEQIEGMRVDLEALRKENSLLENERDRLAAQVRELIRENIRLGGSAEGVAPLAFATEPLMPGHPPRKSPGDGHLK